MTMSKRRFAVLVGAGASHGAGEVKPGPPPLGSELYEWLRKLYPGTWGAVAGHLDAQFRDNFEIGMHDAWTNYSREVQALLIDMGRAFVRFEPPADGSDYYSTLVRGLLENQLLTRCAIASLNYECVLEQAAIQLGAAVGYQRAGQPTNGLVVLKPHGSCNLLPPRGLQVTNSSFVGVGSYYEGPLEPRRLDEIEALYAADYSFPPAMSLYAPGKNTPVGASWVNRARKEWRGVAVNADVVAVIGVRPIWADAHIWDPVLQSHAAIWYIGGDPERSDLAAKASRDVLHLGRTFDEGVDRLNRMLRLLA
jgi:hypothetical protein